MSTGAIQLDPDSTANPARLLPSMFEAESFFMLRAPVLPVATWLKGGQGGTSTITALDALRECWNDARVREAIYLASHSLHERLRTWNWRLESKKDVKLAHALYRYVARMCTRPTPFGLFASVSLGHVGNGTQLDVETTGLRRRTRLDSASTARLCEHLVRDADVRRRLRVRQNDCGHRVGDRWHYVDWRLDRELRQYSLGSVALSEHLQCVLRRIGRDHCNVETLVDALCDFDADLDPDSAWEFVGEMVDSHILIPSLEPLITGDESLPALIEELSITAPSAPCIPVLRSVRDRLKELDETGPGCAPEQYEAIAELLTPLGTEFDSSRLFQVDAYRDAPDLRLPSSVFEEIAKAAEISMTLGGRRDGSLDAFCRRFNERYESRRVPLLKVLDEETGIGASQAGPLPSPLLEGVAWKSSAEDEQGNSALDVRLLTRWHRTLADSVEEIVLDAGDLLDAAEKSSAQTPASLYATATLLAASAGDIDLGNYRILLHGITSLSSASVFGRFCFGEPRLTGCVRASLAEEAAAEPDTIFAEIVHLPHDRVGNVICRPLLREYEILLLGRSGAPVERRISLDDLDVEVRGRRVILWSRRLEKRVIPRMSNAHNYGSKYSLGIYSFLCRLQHHGCLVGGLSWSKSLRALPKLPRVRYGRVVLALAQWNIKIQDVETAANDRPEERWSAFNTLRERLGIPRLASVVEGDNVLAIDFENPIAVEALWHLLRQKRSLHLVETFLDSEHLCAGNGPNRYAHEIIVPLRCRVQQPKDSASCSHFPSATVESEPKAVRGGAISEACSRRLPGSDWLYYRIYGGANTLDRLLVEEFAPLAESFKAQGSCSQWFFIRYTDPDWHLRLRFQGDPARLEKEVIPSMNRLSQALVCDGRLQRIEIGTYEREVERYGGPSGIVWCERWFAQESRRIAKLLEIIRGGNPDWRWQLAGACLVRDLADFGLDPEQRRRIFTLVASGFLDEFGMRDDRLSTVSGKYRQFSRTVQTICSGQVPPELADTGQVLAVLDADKHERRRVGDALRKAEARRELSVDVLLPSLVHMSCNRWFADNPRAHEMVLYELIRRGLESLRAQGRFEEQGENMVA